MNNSTIRFCLYFCFHDSTVLMDIGLHIVEVSRSYSKTPTSVELLWTSGRSSQKFLPENTQQTRETDIYNADGFKPTIPASEMPQTHA